MNYFFLKMKSRLSVIWLLILLLILPFQYLFANSNSPIEVNNSPEWELGRKQVAVVCSTCHGMEGLSTNSLYPNLKGQKKDYLIKQLKLFKAGTRPSHLMESYARPLSEEQINNLALYYSSFPRFEIQSRPVPPPAEQCIACHGPMGKSATELFPNLSGQRFDYLVTQMRNLKSGKRINEVMNPILKNITDEDLQSIARFFTVDRIN